MPRTSTKPRKTAPSGGAGSPSLIPVAPSAETRAFAQRVSGSLNTTVLKDAKTGAETKIDATVAARLQRLLADLAAGHAVAIVPCYRDLTTFEAAEILHVSRPYLIRLIEKGEIPCHRVGTHRRIRSTDMLAYKAKFDKARGDVLSELTQHSQEYGLY